LALTLSSRKEMLVTPFEILDNWRCAPDGFHGASQSNTELREKLTDLPISDIYSRWNWVHRFELEAKRQSMEWHNPQSPRKKKIKKFCVSRQGHDHCLCGLQDDCCRCDAKRGENSYARIRTLTKLRSSASQSIKNLASAWQCMLLTFDDNILTQTTHYAPLLGWCSQQSAYGTAISAIFKTK
jgi:hypothetical protein